jgi:hypothetical protein
MLDLSHWARMRESLEAVCERVTAKAAGREPVAKARNGHNGHGSATLARALATGAARRRGWR